MIGGYLADRGGEDRREVSPVLTRWPAEQRAAETVRIPGHTVRADRLGSLDAGAVQQHSAGNSAGEVLVRLAGLTGASRHADVHPWLDVPLPLPQIHNN